MLSTMREHAKSWVIKVLLGLLALSFAVWGVGDYIQRKDQSGVAEVNGREISQREFAQAYDQDLAQMRKAFGGKLDKETAGKLGLKDQTLNTLINQRLVFKEIYKLRLTASQNQLRREIASNPAFQVDGQFNPERYNNVLATNRLNPADFEAQMAGDISIMQFERAMRTLVTVPDILVEDLYRLEREKRSISLLTLAAADMESEVRPTEAELEAYLKANPDNFQTPLRVKLRYAVLDSESVRDQVTVSEEEIKALYDENQAEMRKQETRHVRHILANSDGTPAGDQRAEAKIREAQNALRQGMDFAEVAKRYSDDTTAQTGGDLGTFSPGAMVPEFDTVAFSLLKDQISDPVKTSFGLHLIRVDAIQAGGTRSLQEAHAELKEHIFQTKAQELVYNQATAMEDQIFSSGDLRTVAKDMNLRYRETDFIDLGAKNLVGIEQLPKFKESAFSTPKGEMSQMVELDDARFFVLQVIDREEPRAKTLQEAKAEVEKGFKQEKARQMAKERMMALLKTLREGKPMVKSDGKIKEKQPQPFSAGEQVAEVPAPTQRAAFQLQPEFPLYPDLIDTGREFQIVRLLKIIEPDMNGLAQARPELVKKLTGERGTEQMSAALSVLRQNSKITVDKKMLERF